jgi:hypothetical protein
MKKQQIKELASYAVAAFFIGIPLQLFVDWASGREISRTPVWVYIFGASVFSLLMTLFKYLSDRRKQKHSSK